MPQKAAGFWLQTVPSHADAAALGSFLPPHGGRSLLTTPEIKKRVSEDSKITFDISCMVYEYLTCLDAFSPVVVPLNLPCVFHHKQSTNPPGLLHPG